MKELSKSHKAAAKNVYAALKILEQNGGQMQSSDMFQTLLETSDFSDYETESTKRGYPRWKMYIQFFSIELKAVGYIVKDKGLWYLTDDGQKALTKHKTPEAFFNTFHSMYSKNRKKPAEDILVEDIKEIKEIPNEIDDLKSKANSDIIDYINQKNPYEFQDLVAALLRAMGYHTPFIAPRGKDGGIDIIAYQDPLGTHQPQLKVQVKHYPKNPISVDVVRALVGVLTKEVDVGLLVTSGSFTNDAMREARNSHQRLRLIDINEFIALWIQYYPKMQEEDKSLLPIIPIYFIKQ